MGTASTTPPQHFRPQAEALLPPPTPPATAVQLKMPLCLATAEMTLPVSLETWDRAKHGASPCLLTLAARSPSLASATIGLTCQCTWLPVLLSIPDVHNAPHTYSHVLGCGEKSASRRWAGPVLRRTLWGTMMGQQQRGNRSWRRNLLSPTTGVRWWWGSLGTRGENINVTIERGGGPNNHSAITNINNDNTIIIKEEGDGGIFSPDNKQGRYWRMGGLPLDINRGHGGWSIWENWKIGGNDDMW